jgi:hypothetical protein
MKQISEEEEKPFTSSLNICPEACCTVERAVSRSPAPTSTSALFLSWFADISLKDDVTVILLLGISFYYFKSQRLAEININISHSHNIREWVGSVASFFRGNCFINLMTPSFGPLCCAGAGQRQREARSSLLPHHSPENEGGNPNPSVYLHVNAYLTRVQKVKVGSSVNFHVKCVPYQRPENEGGNPKS